MSSVQTNTARAIAAALAGSLWASASAQSYIGTPFQRVNEVVLWVHSDEPAERKAYEESVSAYNSTAPKLPARLASLPKGDFSRQVAAAAAAHKLPCILDFDGPKLYEYSAANQLLRLDTLPELKDAIHDLLPSLRAQAEFEGGLYGLGQFESGLALWGNRKLLSKISARLPSGTEDAWNQEEFEEILARLKDIGVQYPIDLKINYGEGEWFSYGFAPLMQSFGGDLVQRSGPLRATGVMNSDASVRAMSMLQSWIRNGYVNPQQTTDDDFPSQRSALSYVGHWAYSAYRKALGDDLVLLPMPRFGTRAVTGHGSWSFGVSTSCPYPTEAARVIAFLLRPAEIQRVTHANGAVPGTLAAIAASEAYGVNGPLRIYTQQLERGLAVSRPPTAHYALISKEFARAVKNIVKGSDPSMELRRAAYYIDSSMQTIEAALSPDRGEGKPMSR